MDNQHNVNQNMQPNNNTKNVVPFAAYPANLPRDYDVKLREYILELVNRKYRPHYFLAHYSQLSATDPNMYPPLDPQTINSIKSQGPDVSEDVVNFEVARVYNKLEAEIYDMALSLLPEDKRNELNALAEQSGNDPSQQQEAIKRIQDFVLANIPNIRVILDTYMNGFANQYMAGRF
ncbi:MAG: hypothetical protein KatS3mg083_017 [Candidatus Dojkabacteria bacterium]|nr:MAG: hypothetical protein KatS3mg083_017 [Candidatus Dojkabacteria bacterium]